MASSSDLTPARAFVEGLRRVNAAWLLVLGVSAVTLALALPLSFVLRGMLADDLGRSLAADRAAAGVDVAWWQEFSARAAELGTSFVPSILGAGGAIGNISGLLDGRPLDPPVAGAVGAWLLIWTFLSGGILDRLARARPTRAHGFFAACGVHFWRFLRLGVVAFAGYALLLGGLGGLLDGATRRATTDLTSERAAFAIWLATHLILGALLILFNVVVDYARVRIVTEDRRSAIGALLAAVRFVRRRPGTLGLALVNAAAFLALMLTYALAAPGASGSGAALWLALGLGQLFIVARHYLKLVSYASETAFFQGALAHAAYTAAPAVVWPESPVAESIVNADPANR